MPIAPTTATLPLLSLHLMSSWGVLCDLVMEDKIIWVWFRDHSTYNTGTIWKQMTTFWPQSGVTLKKNVVGKLSQSAEFQNVPLEIYFVHFIWKKWPEVWTYSNLQTVANKFGWMVRHWKKHIGILIMRKPGNSYCIALSVKTLSVSYANISGEFSGE